MLKISGLTRMCSVSAEYRKAGETIGFVPTMGFLHDGHMSLVRRAAASCDRSVASIFVNPTQFAPHEDFAEYPRDLDRDLGLLREAGIDAVFTPRAEDVYPPGYRTYVEVEDLQEKLCGITRPHFFRGVCTVVLKLFNLVQPHRAFFGQKDAQQAIILRRMVRDLDLDIELEVLPIIREKSGLALSSRNTYLKPEQKPAALSLSRSLREARSLIAGGERKTRRLLERMEEVIRAEPGARIDYLAIVHPENLAPLDRVDDEALVAGAVFVDRVRLIDNTWWGKRDDSLAVPGENPTAEKE